MKEFRDLHRIVDTVFDEAAKSDWTCTRLAREAGLSYRTVNRLSGFKTRYPRAQTVLMLARAVGLRVSVGRIKLKVYSA